MAERRDTNRDWIWVRGPTGKRLVVGIKMFCHMEHLGREWEFFADTAICPKLLGWGKKKGFWEFEKTRGEALAIRLTPLGIYVRDWVLSRRAVALSKKLWPYHAPSKVSRGKG